MKNHRNKILMIAFLAITLISCGSDNDDNNDDTPVREEDTTGSTGTTGTSGTTGTTGGGSTACLTNSQRESIRTFLNRASDLRTFTGTARETVRETDGSTTIADLAGTFDYQQSSETAWVINGDLCSVSGTISCTEIRKTLTLRNGCLFENGNRARNVSATDSSLSYSATSNNTIGRERASIGSGRLSYDTTTLRDGSPFYDLEFDENLVP